MELSEVVGDLEYKGTLRANLESVVADLKCFLSNLERMKTGRLADERQCDSADLTSLGCHWLRQ